MKRLLAFILLVFSAFTQAAEPSRMDGYIVAGHAWTWGKGTVFEAIDATKAISCDALEVFLMWKKLSAETGDLVLDENLPDEAQGKRKAKCEETGLRILNAYIDQKQWPRSELDVTAVTKACAGRIISAHLKDVTRLKLHDVRYGTDVAAVFTELRCQKIAGHIALEYESFDSPTFDEDIRLLVDFIRTNTPHLKY